MFNTIVLATDLSPASNVLVECVAGFKALGVRKVFLTYAMGIRHLDDLKHVIAARVEPALLQQQKALVDQGLDVSIELAPGAPSEEIRRVADEKDASLIVIGSHGETMAQHALFKFGGTASEVLHSFTRPLLMVRTRVVQKGVEICAEGTCANYLENIVYCTDFSDTAQRAFEYVEGLVEAGCKQVTLMHVQDKSKIAGHLADKLDEFNRIDAERLAMRKERLVRKGADRHPDKNSIWDPDRRDPERAAGRGLLAGRHGQPGPRLRPPIVPRQRKPQHCPAR